MDGPDSPDDAPIAKRGRAAEVLDAAARVFARRGYTAATVQDVADELGILKGSLYYYISSKEELLFRLILELHDEVDELLAGVAELDAPPIDRLRAYVERQLDWNVRNLVRVAVYYNDLDLLGPDHRSEVVLRRKAHEDFLTEVIRAAQSDGTSSSTIEAELLSNLVFACLIWPYRWFRPGGALSVEDLTAGCSDFVLRGVIGLARDDPRAGD